MTQLRLKQLNNVNIPKSVVEGITSCSHREFRYYCHSNELKAELKTGLPLLAAAYSSLLFAPTHFF